MTDDQLRFTQVIENLENGKIRLYHIVQEDSHIVDDDNPITTIVVKGYEDIEP